MTSDMHATIDHTSKLVNRHIEFTAKRTFVNTNGLDKKGVCNKVSQFFFQFHLQQTLDKHHFRCIKPVYLGQLLEIMLIGIQPIGTAIQIKLQPDFFKQRVETISRCGRQDKMDLIYIQNSMFRHGLHGRIETTLNMLVLQKGENIIEMVFVRIIESQQHCVFWQRRSTTIRRNHLFHRHEMIMLPQKAKLFLEILDITSFYGRIA